MNKGVLIMILVALGLGAFIFLKMGPSRYDETPAGQEAKKIDEHIDYALGWTKPKKWDARDFLTNGLNPKVPEEFSLGGMTKAECTKLVEALYNAGAEEVAFVNIDQSVRSGNIPEGLYAVLPEKATARQAIFTEVTKYYQGIGAPAPVDVRQKYVYFTFGRWDPKEEDKADDDEEGLI